MDNEEYGKDEADAELNSMMSQKALNKRHSMTRLKRKKKFAQAL